MNMQTSHFRMKIKNPILYSRHKDCLGDRLLFVPKQIHITIAFEVYNRMLYGNSRALKGNTNSFIFPPHYE
jgi:hypothetical protein